MQAHQRRPIQQEAARAILAKQLPPALLELDLAEVAPVEPLDGAAQVTVHDGIGVAVPLAAVERGAQRIVMPQGAVPCLLEGSTIDGTVEYRGDLLQVDSRLVVVQRVEQQTLL